MKDVELMTAWEIVRYDDCYIPFHSHEFYELVYYRKGRGISRIGNTVWEFGDNNFILIPPNVPHDERTFVSCEVSCVGFQLDEKYSVNMYEDAQGNVSRIVESIMEETVKQNLGYKEMLSIRLNELLLTMKRLEQKQHQWMRGVGKSFEYVINYIGENYHVKIRLRDFAEQLNFSYDYFQHKFKEEVGISPQRFLVEKRMEAARRMLMNENINCTEIAYRCGFSNSAQFSAVFKREEGMNPQQYRKERRGNSEELSECEAKIATN